MSYDILNQIRAEMASKDFYLDQVILDGSFYRFDREGNKNAWFVGYQNTTKSGKAYACGAYGDWKEDTKYKFITDGNYTKAEQLEINHYVIRKNEECEKQRVEERRKARLEARSDWNKADTLKSHPYLTVKQIPDPLGARVLKSQLILPLVNTYSEIQGFQKIDKDGNKLFIYGQSNKGNFVILPVGHNLKDVSEAYVCEGYATGASIHMATSKIVVCALNAGNLSPVCWALKQFNPAMKIIIAGDDDRKKKKNVGREKALAAAREVGGDLVFPKFKAGDDGLTDFNDIQVKYGISEVAAQLTQLEDVEHKAPAPVMLATQFLDLEEMKYDQKHRLVAFQSEFYQFDKASYKKLKETDLKNDVMRFMQRHPLAWMQAKRGNLNDVFANIESIVNIKSEKPIPFWISNLEISTENNICLNNGMINVTDVKSISEVMLSPHSSDFFQTSRLDFNFDPKSECPTWVKFLDEMLPDKETRKALQEWFGYNLVHDTKFQKFAIFFGQGANGKSVCCLVLKLLLGDKNVSSISLEAFDPKRTFPLAITVGKLANIVGELSSTSKTEESELKKFVTGEPMTIERKGKDAFVTIPSARLTFATNALPRFNDNTDGTWRRIQLFPFKKQILDSSKQDRRLVDPKFWTESGEIEGIFNWALEGLLRLRANGAFTVSNEMNEALSEYKLESNPTREFLLDVCEVKNGNELVAKVLYVQYKAHMLNSGYEPLGEAKFANEVKLAFPTAKKSKDAKRINEVMRSRVWFNLSLKFGFGGVL